MPDRTVVLVVTQLDDPTADLVITELNRRGRVDVVRVDPGDFPHAVTLAATVEGSQGWRGRLATESREVDLADVRSVYWRRPSPYRFPGLSEPDHDFATLQARDGFGGVIASLGCRYANHPHRNHAAEFKPAQLAVAADLGFAVPPTVVTSDAAAVRAFADEHGAIVFKPLRLTELVRHGRPQALWAQRVGVDELDDSISGTAHLFQAEVRKTADLRVTVVGERCFAVRIDSPPGLLDWRTDYEALAYQSVDLGTDLRMRLRAFLARFGLGFACFDFALAPDGTPWFLECNPNGQWAWLEPPTGLPMTAAFADDLEGSP